MVGIGGGQQQRNRPIDPSSPTPVGRARGLLSLSLSLSRTLSLHLLNSILLLFYYTFSTTWYSTWYRYGSATFGHEIIAHLTWEKNVLERKSVGV